MLEALIEQTVASHPKASSISVVPPSPAKESGAGHPAQTLADDELRKSPSGWKKFGPTLLVLLLAIAGLCLSNEKPRSQAKENLARVSDEIELAVQAAYNKLERTPQMLKVSEELLSLRTESRRVRQQEFEHGAAFNAQAGSAVAQEYDAKTLLLQSQLDYTQTHDEITHAMGRMPE